MSRKAMCVSFLSLTIAVGSGPNIKRMSDLSRKEGWVFLVYSGFHNKTYFVNSGQVDVIYPRTDVARELGLPWSRDLDHSADPSLSPDGNFVAYVRRRSAAEHNEAITIHNVRDNTARDLIVSTKDISRVYWSPTGKEVAFVAYPDRFTLRLYTVDIHTSQVTELNPGHQTVSMSWSPDGKQFVAAEAPISLSKEQSQGGLFIVNRETKSRTRLGDGAMPSWSPNGELIAYLDADKEDCYTIKPDGTSKQKLLSYRPRISSDYRLMGPLIWSPDGQRYLIYHREDGEKGDQRRIYLFDLKNGKKQEIFSDGPLEVVGWGIARR
jgi:Tol biopolymer transport system component